MAADKKPYSFDSIEFVPFKNAKLENIDSMINCAVYLTLNNFHDPLSTNIQFVEIETANPVFTDNIRNVISKYSNLLVILKLILTLTRN